MARLRRLGGWKTRLVGRQGLALIAVLWGVTLLAVIATSFTTTTRTETKLALNLIENTKAKALADAGIYRAVLALIEDRRISLQDNEAFEDAVLEGEDDALVRLEFGTAREAESPDEAESPGAFLHADATPYRWGFAGAEVVIAVQDEGGKINLNGAEELVEALLRSAGLGPGGSQPDRPLVASPRKEPATMDKATHQCASCGSADAATELGGGLFVCYACALQVGHRALYDGPPQAAEKSLDVLADAMAIALGEECDQNPASRPASLPAPHRPGGFSRRG